MKVEQLYESIVYRGIGGGSNSRTIRWVSTEHKLANQYAVHRELVSKRRAKTVEIQFTPKKAFEVGNDREWLSPSSFIARAVRGSPLAAAVALPAINKFREHFEKGERPIVKYWATEQDKKVTAEFLKSFGYDSIKITEDNAITYGILR